MEKYIRIKQVGCNSKIKMVSRKNLSELFFPHDNKPQHLKALDGLRGIAVLLVLLSHTSGANMFFHTSLNFKNSGKIGVYLFFVLSAYLLDRQIAIAFMKNKSSKKYWKNYFLRRSLRIYPLFVMSLLLHGLFTLLGINTVIDKFIDVPLHMILAKGESVFWSIPVEFKYYFISPLIMYSCHRFLKWDKQKLFIFFITLTGFTFTIQLIHPLSSPSTLRYFPIFIVGTFISIYELIFRDEIKQFHNPRMINIGGVSAFLIILITIPFFFDKIFGFKFDFLSAMFYFPYAVIWGIVLLSAKYGNGLIRKLLESKFLRFIGVISFSLYLFHMLFIEYVRQLTIPQNLKIYLFFILTFLFSCLSYLIIERPLSKIRLHSRDLNSKIYKNKELQPTKVNRK